MNRIYVELYEMKAQVRGLLDDGVGAGEVFSRMTGQGVDDKKIASLIASYATPVRCECHAKWTYGAIAIIFIEMLAGFLALFGMAEMLGATGMLIVGVIVVLVSLLFAWGFYRHSLGMYNVFIVLSLMQMPSALKGFSEEPVSVGVVFMINVIFLTLIWYARSKLFPDVMAFGPKKIAGKYVFVN
ncbi:MAG TPA: hypothetical protein DCW29_23765 [Janthinobacterium sp.]|nr:hypothetical protein [Janthinobacterium sp.]